MSKSDPIAELIKILSMEASEANPKTVLAHEPKLSGYPFPQAIDAAPVVFDEKTYRPVLYVYDEQQLKTLQAAQITNSTPPVPGVDADGKSYTKVQVNGIVYKEYLNTLDPEQRIAPVKLDVLGLNADSSMQMAIAEKTSNGDEHSRLLLMRVMGNSSDKGINALIKAGLLHKDWKESTEAIPIHFNKIGEEAACTIALPIPESIAEAIVRSPANRCADWTTDEAKEELEIDADSDVDDLMNKAAETLTDLRDPEVLNPARASVPASRPKRHERNTTPVNLTPKSDEMLELLPSLSAFADELKKADLVQTTQMLGNGKTRTVIGVRGNILYELSTGAKNRRTSSVALSIGRINIDDIADHKQYPLKYYTISDSELARLVSEIGTIPTTAPLPPDIPKNPFGIGSSGDFGTSMPVALKDVVMHESGEGANKTYHVYMISNVPKRMEDIALKNLKLEEGQIHWVTEKDKSPSILRLNVSAGIFAVLKTKKIGKPNLSNGVPNFEDITIKDDSTKSGQISIAQLEADLIKEHEVSDKKNAPKVKGAEGKTLLSNDEGQPKLIETLQAALSQTEANAASGGNQPTEKPIYLMALAKVRHTIKKETRDARTLYVRGINRDLKQLIGKIKAIGWLDDDQFNYLTGKGAADTNAGVIEITLPDSAWKTVAQAFPTMPKVTPQKPQHQAGLPPDHDTFARQNYVKEAVIGHFNQLHTYDRILSAEDLAFINLRDKHLRFIEVSNPNPHVIKALDDQIAKIQRSLSALEQAVTALNQHKAALAFEEEENKEKAKGGGSQKERARKADGVLEVVTRATEIANGGLSEQGRLVKQLEAKIAGIKNIKKGVLDRSKRKEIVILDPDTDTVEKLNNAKELTQTGSVETVDGNIVHFAPSNSFVDRLRKESISAGYLAPAAHGQVNEALRDARQSHLEQLAAEAEAAAQAAPDDGKPKPPVKHKPRYTRSIPKIKNRLCPDITPILVYEKVVLPDGTPSTQPVLVMQAITGFMGQIDTLAEDLQHKGWLQDSASHPVSWDPKGIVGAPKTEPVAAAAPIDCLDETIMERMEFIIRELKFYLPRISHENENIRVDSHNETLGFLKDISPLIAQDPESFTSKKISEALKTSGLEPLLKKGFVAGDTLPTLQRAVEAFAAEIKNLQQQALPTKEEISPSARSRSRNGAHIPKTDVSPLVTVKLYITQDAAAAFQVRDNNSGVDIRNADPVKKAYSPQYMQAFVDDILAQEAHPKKGAVRR